MGNANKCPKIPFSNGEENEIPETTHRSGSPPKVNHF